MYAELSVCVVFMAIGGMLEAEGAVLIHHQTQKHTLKDLLHSFFVPKYNACTAERRIYYEGAYHVNNNCTISECLKGRLLLTQDPALKVEFHELQAKKCVYIVANDMHWTAARAHCVTNGGDLYVAGDFQGLSRYLREQYGSGKVWVGVQYRKWIDGQPVRKNQWATGEPNGPHSQCAHVDASTGTLRDDSCSHTAFALCHKGVHYM